MSARLLKGLIIAAAISVLPLAFVAVWLWCIVAYDTPYDRVARGDTEAHVRALLGKPDRVTGPPENVAWNSESSIKANHGECIREFWYVPPIALQEYTIGFDAHNQVVSKYRYQSR